jgi:lipopolysaccharide transport system permease protein
MRIREISPAPADVRVRARRLLEVLSVLAVSDLQMRYGRGGIRALKWLLDPYAALGIYLLLIVLILDRSGSDPGLSLACAIVPFQLVTTTFAASLRAVPLRSTIIANMTFPRGLIPLSALATESIAFCATFTLLPLMMIIYWVPPTAAILWLPVAVAVTAAFAAGISYPAVLLGVWYPELSVFFGSFVRALFFVAPGLVALDQITGTAHDVMPLNPFTGLFEMFRDALLYGQSPAAWEILSPLAAGGILVAIFLPLYRREQPYLAKLVG